MKCAWVLPENMYRPFWAGAAGNAVVIEADAFKESDVIYKALSSRGHHDMLQTAELVCSLPPLLSLYMCVCALEHVATSTS